MVDGKARCRVQACYSFQSLPFRYSCLIGPVVSSVLRPWRSTSDARCLVGVACHAACERPFNEPSKVLEHVQLCHWCWRVQGSHSTLERRSRSVCGDGHSDACTDPHRRIDLCLQAGDANPATKHWALEGRVTLNLLSSCLTHVTSWTNDSRLITGLQM